MSQSRFEVGLKTLVKVITFEAVSDPDENQLRVEVVDEQVMDETGKVSVQLDDTRSVAVDIHPSRTLPGFLGIRGSLSSRGPIGVLRPGYCLPASLDSDSKHWLGINNDTVYVGEFQRLQSGQEESGAISVDGHQVTSLQHLKVTTRAKIFIRTPGHEFSFDFPF
jgi:hypothetical protein